MGKKIILKNKRAGYDYQLFDKYEAGITLVGTEVKSLRTGKGHVTESYIMIDKKNEMWIYNMHIPHYEFGNINNHQENRKRKLLLNAQEIVQIDKSMKLKGLTLVPTIVYFKNSYVKIEIALAKGKKLFDKRSDQAKKDVERKLRQGKYE